MEIEFKERTKVKAVIYGKECMLTKPTVGQVEVMQAEVAKDEGNSMQIMKKFALEMGLPVDVANSMELDHFIQLIEQLTGQKKK